MRARPEPGHHHRVPILEQFMNHKSLVGTRLARLHKPRPEAVRIERPAMPGIARDEMYRVARREISVAGLDIARVPHLRDEISQNVLASHCLLTTLHG